MMSMSHTGYKNALFHCTAEQRERLFSTLRESLVDREGILFAYVYGSFGEDLPFHDIDVGIYLTRVWDREDAWLDIELAGELELVVSQAQVVYQSGIPKEVRKPRIPVDVRVLNGAPVAFSYHVLRGQLLFSRDEAVRVPWVAQIFSRYLDLKPLRHAALKEAMTSWA